MFNQPLIERWLNDLNVVLTDSHVVLSSGEHSSGYFDKHKIYPHTGLTSALCKELARPFFLDRVDVVVAPATGGIILSQWVSHFCTVFDFHPVLSLYADRVGDELTFKHGYGELVRKQRVLLVDDVLTTGKSLGETKSLVNQYGGKVIGAAVICDRGDHTAKTLGVPKFSSLFNMPMQRWSAKQCPLCEQGIPINLEVGHGLAMV